MTAARKVVYNIVRAFPCLCLRLLQKLTIAKYERSAPQSIHDQESTAPRLSVLVAIYNMQREAPRTLFTLSSSYQRAIAEDDFEVIVADNGSSQPWAPDRMAAFGKNFSYRYAPPGNPSPVSLLNEVARAARGEYIGIMIDGARLVTPGMLATALRGLALHPRAVVVTLGFHLGPELQNYSMLSGYDQRREDDLLTSLPWQQNGYALFSISTLAASSSGGFFLPLAESNCLFMRRTLYEELGGMDPAFDLEGGGLANLDFFRRACEFPGTELIVLLGEASFHQFHGGTATNQPPAVWEQKGRRFLRQYEEIRGAPFSVPTKEPVFFGTVPQEALPVLLQSVQSAMRSATV